MFSLQECDFYIIQSKLAIDIKLDISMHIKYIFKFAKVI